MRLGIGTVKGKWVNLHLLVSPEDPEHIVQLTRLLARLTFSAHDDSFCCNREELIRLGKCCDPAIANPIACLEHGSQQFKVSFDQLKQIYIESSWAKQNVLIAVAGSETDGTSGVRDSADTTLRQEVEKFSHIIFASSEAQREFWLGRRSAAESELKERFGGLKPCMHGIDAHEIRTVGVPDGNRYSWIKGAREFDALRQACIDPDGRAFVGVDPPSRATPSQVIATVEVTDAPWAKTSILGLSPGLVAIIGARGSGKTALADMLALGCDATSERLSPVSFLIRARELLHGASVLLRWQTGEERKRSLDGSDESSSAEYPRARYLSQQFVEELCAAHGMTDALLSEIQRVIFEAHPLSDRDGTVDFDELLEMRATRFREARAREEDALADLSEQISGELEKQKQVSLLNKQILEKRNLIKAYTNDRAKLVAKGSEERVKRLGLLTDAADKVRSYLRYFTEQEQSLLSLKDEVSNVRNHQAPEALRRSQERQKSSGLKPDQWTPFLLDYKGDVDGALTTHLATSRDAAKSWRGTTPIPPADPAVALIADDAQLDHIPLAVLQA
jgi:hypothetical protein